MGVSGGPTKNKYLMQFQSDILGLDVLVPSNEEMTCLGIAYIAGISLGIMERSQIQTSYKRMTYSPLIHDDQRTALEERWKLAVKQTLCR